MTVTVIIQNKNCHVEGNVKHINGRKVCVSTSLQFWNNPKRTKILMCFMKQEKKIYKLYS